MKHVSQTNLIKLAAGELPPEQRREVESHLASCRVCRTAAQQHAVVRDLLGDWAVDAGSRDVWSAIEPKLDEPRIIRPAWGRVYRLGRVAAVVVLGVGLGYGAGRLMGARPSAPKPTLPVANADEALAKLGFDAIESPSATGLFLAIVPDETSAAEGTS